MEGKPCFNFRNHPVAGLSEGVFFLHAPYGVHLLVQQYRVEAPLQQTGFPQIDGVLTDCVSVQRREVLLAWYLANDRFLVRLPS